ncbi:hypothetical protein BYT27DRAFT_7075657 [Phlegmacium glaucopus]|nr:hypothetical protein BYT27DRAFT_7075657 [Phlegmacium glaucopus]
MFSWLPTALLILLFASPVFSEPTSPNDPFRAIILQVPKTPEPPICCLKPLPPLELVDDEVLLSFEEWKTKQTAMQASTDAKAREATNRSSLGGDTTSDNGSESMLSLHDVPPSVGSSKPEKATPEQRMEVSPHFRVPLTDRFNYASLDCSARVHTSHRSAKSASSILSSKRDRYMLSPCNSPKEKKFVVVELCDDIRIDTVQLANFEFFSGVFKDFSVSVAKTYSTDVDGWTHVGTYRAKNVRGVQSFHPPTSLRDFYRYIRIDFETHYGNEYFCPVSLLRVYGLTHLEQWKWDIWEAESRVKQADLQKDRKITLPNGAILEDPIPTQTVRINKTSSLNASIDNQSDNTPILSVMDPIAKHITVDKFPSDNSLLSSSPLLSTAISELQTEFTATLSSIETAISTINGPNDPITHILDSPSTDVHVPSPSSNVNIPSSVVNQSQASNMPISSSGPHSPHPSVYEHAIPNNINASTAVPSHSSSPPTISGTPAIVVGAGSPSVAVIPAVSSPVPPTTRGAESIYSTIMNRLTAIESNHTLYTRYIDQQNSVIREVIKRLGEDVGRLEGISRAQTLMHQRTVDDWEMQRYQLEMEYHDLVSRVENLSEEIVLEKRLGIAQLCLLLAVVVFMGLTRGSRTEIEHGPVRFNSTSMKEWGKRQFSFGSDWTNRFKGKNNTIASRSSNRSQERSRSGASARPQPQKPSHAYGCSLLFITTSGLKFTFPSRQPRGEPLETIQLNSATGQYYPQTGTTMTSRSRAPSLRSPPSDRRTQHTVQNKAITPTRPSFRPLQRSNSQGGSPMHYTNSWGVGNNISKSARKWARTAHLHEVRSAVPYSVFSSAGGGSGHRTKRGSNERPGPRFDHDRAGTPREFEFDSGSEDIFSPISGAPRGSASKGRVTTARKAEPKFPDGLLFKADRPADDGDAWVDTDSVDGSELGVDLVGEF